MYTQDKFKELKSLLLSYESLMSSIDSLIKPTQTITLTDLSIVQKEKVTELADLILKARNLGLDTDALEAFLKHFETASLSDLTKDYETIKSNLEAFHEQLMKVMIKSLSKKIKILFDHIKSIRDGEKENRIRRKDKIVDLLKFFDAIITNAKFLNFNIDKLNQAKNALKNMLETRNFKTIEEQVLDVLWQFGFDITHPLKFVETASTGSLDQIPLDLFRDFMSKMSDLKDLIPLSQASKDLHETTGDILKNNYIRLLHGQCASILHKIAKDLVTSSDNYELRIAGAVLFSIVPGAGLGGMVGFGLGLLAFGISGQFILSVGIAAAIVGSMGWIIAAIAFSADVYRSELSSSTKYNIRRLNHSIMKPDEFAGCSMPHFADTITEHDLNSISLKNLFEAFNKIKDEDHKRFIFEACLDHKTNLGKRFLHEQGFFGQENKVEVRERMQAYLGTTKQAPMA